MTAVQEPTTALATTDYPKLAEVTGFSSGQINLIRQTVATGASIVEVAWYLYNAKRLGLEPTLDQIYLIRYKQGAPAEIVVGINGYRAQAESSGAYAGSDDALFDYEDVGQPKGAPSKATVTVWKLVGGVRCPFTASARWEEFYPGAGPIGEQYRKRPHNQLSVRAESHALRKAFPYQTQRLAPKDAPAFWIEAAEADQAQHNDPRRVALNAARYDEIAGSENGGTFFDGPDQHTTPAGKADRPARAEQREAPASDGAAATTEGERMLTVRSKEYSAYADLCETAQALEVDYEALTAPVAASVLAERHSALSEAVQAARDAAAQQTTAF